MIERPVIARLANAVEFFFRSVEQFLQRRPLEMRLIAEDDGKMAGLRRP